MFLLLFALVHQTAFAAKESPKIECARMRLSAIYGAEKSYHSEYDKFSESYSDIGFEPDPAECGDWQGSIRVFSGGQEFLATYTKPATGEAWQINEKKELRQTSEGR